MMANALQTDSNGHTERRVSSPPKIRQALDTQVSDRGFNSARHGVAYGVPLRIRTCALVALSLGSCTGDDYTAHFPVRIPWPANLSDAVKDGKSDGAIEALADDSSSLDEQ